MTRIAALSLTLALAACTSAPTPPPPVALDTLMANSQAVPAPKPQIIVKQVCITTRNWTKAELHALKLALTPIPETSPIMTMALDWNRMRDDVAACVASQRPKK